MNAHEMILSLQEEIQKIPIQDFSFESYSEEDLRTSKIHQFIRDKLKNLDETLKQRILDEFEGLGPLEALFKDEAVTEIIINNRQHIWFEKKGHLHRHPDFFASDFTYNRFIIKICELSGLQFNLNEPFAQGRYLDFRLQIVSSEITKQENSICLRRHPVNPWNFESLLEKKWSSAEQINLIKKMIKDKANFLIVGSTGSGKTSVIGACLKATEESERSIILEDTWELPLPNLSSIKLLTREDSQKTLRGIDLSELVKQSLRMRPDRLVVGEIRGPEAKDLLMALSTGHKGSFGSLHASSAQQAMLRLEMLIQLGAPHWSLQAIRTLIFLSLEYIIVVKRSAGGERNLEGLYKIMSREDFGFLLEKIA